MSETFMTEDLLRERYDLSMERIKEIASEGGAIAPFDTYFKKTAQFIVMMDGVYKKIRSGAQKILSMQQLRDQNRKMYEDILPENYEESFENPAYAVKVLGTEHGRMLSFLYDQIRGLIGYIFEGRLEEAVIHLELFIEVFGRYETEVPEEEAVRDILYWFLSDYSDLFCEQRILESIDPSYDFASTIIEESDLTDLSYLYRYGEYITEDEEKLAAFMNKLSEEEVRSMASTYTEGYRIGFVHAKKPLEKKRTVNIRYHVGMERMVRMAIENFEKMGLRPVIFRYALSAVNRKGSFRVGFTGATANPQADYDHGEDAALFLDKKFVERRLGVMKTVYEDNAEMAAEHAGPAVIETWGEEPFAPQEKEEAYHLSEKQQALASQMNGEISRLTNHYIHGEERSFTIISFPLPQIGEKFEEIFAETVRINTLDNEEYTRVQETLIAALDQGSEVHILGANGNETDLTVSLAALTDPQHQTIFENCVADVNIPVGEVFTSPVLKGTNGLLHVKQVFLNGLDYRDLRIELKDGRTGDYSCGNFEDPAKGKEYIKTNILFHHDFLPLGEFAIGTNTPAYAMARKYGIGAMLPILIAEKTGPHFALGDTCYSFEEDVKVYNPDGKEIVAKENEIAALRNEDPAKAYFGCHTDITIPYEELGLIEVIRPDGSREKIIENGKFVLAGTESLNKALED